MKGHPQRRYFKFSNESAENLLVPLREETAPFSCPEEGGCLHSVINIFQDYNLRE